MRIRSVLSVVAMVAFAVTIGVVAPQSVDAAACEASSIPPASSAAAVVSAPAQSTGFHAIAPVRLLDSRGAGAVVRAGCTLVLDLAGSNAIPAAAEAVALNITTVDAASRGFVTVYPCGSPRPAASNVNTRMADATANSVLVEIDATEQVCIYTQTSLHLIADATGWFGRFGDAFHAAPSTRVLDTRTSLRPDAGSGPLAANTQFALPIAGVGAVPADATAVAVNVTTTDATQAGFVTVYPCGTPRPPTSTVNFPPVEQRSNHVVIGIGDAALCIWSNVSANVIVDVEGWFGGAKAAGTTFRPLLGSRVVDTRDGTGVVAAKLAAETTTSFDPSAHARLPIGSTVALNVVATEADAPGFVTLYPCAATRPDTSAVNAVVGSEATNVAFVTVDSTNTVCLYVSAPMHVVIDVIGTFGPSGPLRGLTLMQRTLGQTFDADAHDYTMQCVAGDNPVTLHAVGAPGTVVSVALSTAPAPTATSSTLDQTLTMHEDEAFVVRAGPAGGMATEYWVRCLPHDFPALQVTTAATPDPGWYLTDASFPVGPGDQSRFLMVLDNRSVPVWYHRVTSPSIDLTLMPDGLLAWTKLLGMAFGADPAGVFEIHRLDGTLVRGVKTVSGPTDHHDIAELPNGNIVLASYVPRQHVNLTVLGAGYGADELVYDAHLEEIRPDGTVAWTWKSEDHVPVSATTFPVRFPGVAGVGVDPLHVNSIDVAPDGDLIVSARHTDTVYKIRRDTAGDIVWRLGGNQSDFTFVDDPLFGFGRQHDAQLLADGNVRVFDNRTALSGAPRAVEYAVDTGAHTATLVWAVSTPTVTASGGVGSVRGPDGGDAVVTWGGSTSPAFTEVARDGTVLQTTTVIGHYGYRTDKQPFGAFDLAMLRATAGH